MEYTLTKKPRGAKIVIGFPSIGLVSTIATKFMIDHLDVEVIGDISSEKMIPLTAIHKSNIVEPITLYYNKKYNIIIVQSITDVIGLEWDITKTILKIAKDVDAKEIVVLEGIPSFKEEINLFYYSTKKINLKVNPLKEGIIMGVTASLLLKAGKIPITCLFAETHSNLPDSEAAAKIVETLDGYLGFKIDVKPLFEQAKKFESSLKQYIEKSRGMLDQKQKKELSYFG